MLHEDLQTDVISVDETASCPSSSCTVGTARHVRRGRVELGEEETGLGPSRVADDVSRDRVPVRQQILQIKSEAERCESVIRSESRS